MSGSWERGCQAERGGRRPEASVAAARVSGARRVAARCAAQQNGPGGVTSGVPLLKIFKRSGDTADAE